MRSFLTVFLTLFLLSAPAYADHLEDGIAAFNRKDYETARKLLQPLADAGNGRAQYDIGQTYYWGFGVDQDAAEALKWFRKAANNGYARAQYMLGYLYDNGVSGVGQDFKEAIKWYRKAAEQGNIHAQIHLGGLYAAGKGEDNFSAAYFWLSLSKMTEDDAVPFNEKALRFGDLLIMEEELSADEKTSLDGRVAEWILAHPAPAAAAPPKNSPSNE